MYGCAQWDRPRKRKQWLPSRNVATSALRCYRFLQWGMAAEQSHTVTSDTAQQNGAEWENKGKISQNAHNGCLEELPPPMYEQKH